MSLSTDELACVYAALLLQDDGVAVTAEKIATVLKAADVDVEAFWPGLFARALDGVDVKTLISNVSSGVGAAPAGGAAAAPAAGAAAPAAAAEEKKEEKKKEESEDEDEDMGFGLFD